MNVFPIFVAAVAIDDPQRRAEYLAQACGDDLTLRRRVEELLAAHEESGEFLDVPALQQMAGTPGRLADETEGNEGDDVANEGDDVADGGEDIAALDLSFLTPSDNPNSLGSLLHYDVRELVGYGGCGIVFRAFDEKLHRVVAIKAMNTETAASSPARKRFLREARATAAISHDNVVQIFAVEEQPRPFIVMEYIDGQTLHDRIVQSGPLDPRDVATMGAQIARGLEAAHAMGLIHRDVKPANILIASGSLRPKLTDFGLARTMDDVSLTKSGFMVGTPLYMSPEQAEGASIDQRSDLFSFGSVLYVMCSGRPPFRAPTTLAVLNRVVADTPRPISEIVPDVPEWLTAIIERLHAKRPADRLPTARQAAELLERRQYPGPAPHFEPTPLPQASETGPSAAPTRAAREWTATLLLSMVNVALAVAIMLGVLWWMNQGADRPTRSADEPTSAAAPLTPVAVATPSATPEREPTGAAPAIGAGTTAEPPASASTLAVTGAEFVVRHFEQPRDPTRSVAFTPDERHVIAASNGDHHEIHGNVRVHVAGRDNSVRVWNLESGVPEYRFPMSEGQRYGPLNVSVSPDGAMLAVASGWETANGPSEPRVYVFDLKTGERLHHFEPFDNHAMRAVAFSTRGTLSAVRSGQGGIQTWVVPTGDQMLSVTMQGIPRAEAPRLTWSPDGEYILGGEWVDGTKLLCWARETGAVVGSYRGHGSRPRHAAMTPDSKIIISCSDDNTVRLWDRATEHEKLKVNYPSHNICCVAISPDGALFVSGSENGVLQLHDAHTGRLIESQATHAGEVRDLAFSSSGNLFASVGNDRSVQVHRIKRNMQAKVE